MLPSKGGIHMKQKHMTKEMRERVEKGIREGESLKEIAHAIDKDPTTISKEVLKHRSDAVPQAVLWILILASNAFIIKTVML